MPDRLLPTVAIPARNEEDLLPRLVAALGRQTVLDHLAAPLDVIVVLNNTTDGSLRALKHAAALSPRLRLTVENATYPPDRAHVGTARARAMDLAAEASPAGVILTSDADAVPSRTWIEANLSAIDAGADIVGGRIVGDPGEEAQLGAGFQRRAGLYARCRALCDELAALVDPLPHDPWPRHSDHTGGSLAVRTEVYRAVGGMEPLPFREDVGFVSRVRAAGFLLRHPLEVEVTVSARTVGRAKGGMADCVAAWLSDEAAGVPVLVECPFAVEARLRRRRRLRDSAGGGPAAAALVEGSGLDGLDAPATVPALAAIVALTERLASLRGIADAA